MAIGTPVLLDSIRFVDHSQVMPAIADDEVEIKVKAAGVRFVLSNRKPNLLTNDTDEL